MTSGGHKAERDTRKMCYHVFMEILRIVDWIKQTGISQSLIDWHARSFTSVEVDITETSAALAARGSAGLNVISRFSV